ncbi:MAG: AmmeMemoRadiSam system radical SAM enzyme [Candidatus Margulisbacteria bacterium]|nr:AmmeMemoRadiSam system radical SAM enzyme [Candidatus Margulisiibacteriota bacterium]
MDLKEALLYEVKEKKRVQCHVCPWNCIIAEGKVGHCGVRQNVGGKLYSLIYSKVSSLTNDPIEKKPLYHFHPGTYVMSAGTVGCNFRCLHCQNWTISQVRPDEIYLKTVTPEQLVESAKDQGSSGVAWTYNEPTIWLEYMLDGAKLAKKAGLYTVSVTNGYINEEALELIGPYIDAYALDIKAWNLEFAKEICGVPNFEPVLKAAVLMKKKWKAHVEVTTNVIPGKNDDDEQLRNIAKWIEKNMGKDTPWHLSRAFPYYKLMDFRPTPVETLERGKAIGLEEGLKVVHLGNV